MSAALVFSVLALSTLVTSFISGILGMAGGMILMGVLLALLPLPAAMMLHGISQLASNGGRAFMLRKEVDWRVFRGYAIGAAIALSFFAATHLVVGKAAAMILMGLTPFVVLALPEKLHLNVERRGHSTLCGLVCLALSLTAGIAGPILDVFFVRSKMSRHAVVATKALTQTMSHLIKIIYFGGMMAIQGSEVTPKRCVVPAMDPLDGDDARRDVSRERAAPRAYLSLAFARRVPSTMAANLAHITLGCTSGR